MTWTPLDYAVISDDEHNSDVIDATEAVRRIVGDLRVAYLGTQRGEWRRGP